MKFSVSKFFTALVLVLSTGAIAQDYKEGVNYFKLEKPAFELDNSVVKIYSTNCPFCYKYEKAVMPGFIKNLPEGTEYDSFHILDKPPFGKEKATVIAVTRELAKDKYREVKLAYYERLHDKKKKFSSSEEVTEFGLKIAGISQSDYDRQLTTETFKNTMDQWKAAMEIARLQGVPAIVVNGEYVIKTSSIRSMAMLDDLTATLLEM